MKQNIWTSICALGPTLFVFRYSVASCWNHLATDPYYAFCLDLGQQCRHGEGDSGTAILCTKKRKSKDVEACGVHTSIFVTHRPPSTQDDYDEEEEEVPPDVYRSLTVNLYQRIDWINSVVKEWGKTGTVIKVSIRV